MRDRMADPERTKDDLWRHLVDVHHLSMAGYPGHYTKTVLIEIHRGTHKRETAVDARWQRDG